MKSFLQTFALYRSLGMYRSNKPFLAKVNASSTGKLLDSLHSAGAVTGLSSDEFNVNRRENYQHHHHHDVFLNIYCLFINK